ncbi:MAG: trypsin-like peptidase domain-containing protein [Chloroflexi bacterium]|nr:trypsin-like peptidase domain-containing protein [Chloroflexota bacterium]
MDRENRFLVISITVVSVLAILFVTLVWPGPDGALFSDSSSTSIFDENLVEEVYYRVSPAVVEVYADLESNGTFTEISAGSGFLIDRQGHIITNDHVVRNADRVRISFFDGADAVAVVLGRNPANDIAMLKVEAALVSDIEPVTMGDSSLVRPGQLAIIIGSPFGLKNSVAVGISSGINRGLPSGLGRFIPGMLQTDALISPGNSGGPMLNSAGQVVGITTAIEFSSDQVNQRIGFAVPINIVQKLIPHLKVQKVVRPPWLGILSQSLKPLIVERLDLPLGHGFYVVQTTPNGPADVAGLIGSGFDDAGQPASGGDIIIAINDVPVSSGAEMTAQINRNLPGDEITLTVVRNGQEERLTLVLGQWPGQ